MFRRKNLEIVKYEAVLNFETLWIQNYLDEQGEWNMWTFYLGASSACYRGWETELYEKSH